MDKLADKNNTEEKSREIIKEAVFEIFEKAGIPVQVELRNPLIKEESGWTCLVKTETDSSLLIGQQGANLQAWQHLARLVVRKRISEKVKFTLDINNYRFQRSEAIIKMSREAAEQALREKKAVVLKPMSAYERRLVHLELVNRRDVETQSIGEGEDRKVVVKPVENF